MLASYAAIGAILYVLLVCFALAGGLLLADAAIGAGIAWLVVALPTLLIAANRK